MVNFGACAYTLMSSILNEYHLTVTSNMSIT